MNAVSEQTVLAMAAPEAAVVVKALLQVLPAHCVLSRTEDTRPYECDGLSLYRSVPMAVVLPETEAQVQAVLITCKKLNVPVAGLIPDSQRYFDIHHTNNDVFENVNHRELELGSVILAQLIYLVSEHELL